MNIFLVVHLVLFHLDRWNLKTLHQRNQRHYHLLETLFDDINPISWVKREGECKNLTYVKTGFPSPSREWPKFVATRVKVLGFIPYTLLSRRCIQFRILVSYDYMYLEIRTTHFELIIMKKFIHFYFHDYWTVYIDL